MTDEFDGAQSEAYEPVPSAGSGGKDSGQAALNAWGRTLMEQLKIATDANGITYAWNGRYWAEATVPVLKKRALMVAGERSSNRHREEIVAYVKAASLDEHLAWGRVGAGEVACANGVVDVAQGRRRQHRAEDYLERVIPWPWDPGAGAPLWDQCLIDWFGEAEEGAELIAALQDFAGYVCLSHARYKKALILHGPSNTGKSLVVGAFRLLVGPASCCQLPVQHMDDPVLRAVIKGKALNLMSELSADAMVADGGFKTLVSTEEPILINEKFKPAETYVPSAKHVIATNSLPQINDKTEATYNRLLIVPMERVVAEADQDPLLLDHLGAEMPGILAWAVEGARRLVARSGEWPRPERSAVALQSYRDEQNPIVAFLAECAEPEPEITTPLIEVARLYNQWNAGARKVGARHAGRMLRRAGRTVKNVRYRSRVLSSLIGYRLLGLPQEDLVGRTEDAQEAPDGG